ncbi:MAG: hypothetical protein ACYDH5_05665 [Acidimicrobiales bacterium]
MGSVAICWDPLWPKKPKAPPLLWQEAVEPVIDTSVPTGPDAGVSLR